MLFNRGEMLTTVRQFRQTMAEMQRDLRKLTETKEGHHHQDQVLSQDEMHRRQLTESDGILDRTTQSIQR